jgi:hypothetical protein
MKVEIELTTLNALIAIAKAHRKIIPDLTTKIRTKENTAQYIDQILNNNNNLTKDVWYITKGNTEYFIHPFKLKSATTIFTGTRQQCKDYILKMQTLPINVPS